MSLVLLVGGSFAVSGLLANAKDSNAKNDLALVAAAEAASQADGGPYLAWSATAAGTVSGDKDLDGNTLDRTEVGFTTTPGVAINVNANGAGWVAAATSTTGTKFFRSSKQSTIYIGSIPASAYDAGLTDPSVAAPYNAANDCTGTVPSATYVDESAIRNLNLTVTGNTISIIFDASGTALCDWARSANFNLGGDTLAGTLAPVGQNDLRIFDTSGIEHDFRARAITAAITTSDTSLAGTRHVSIAYDLDSLGTFPSAAAIHDGYIDYGGFLDFTSSRTGKLMQLVHYGPDMPQ
ncbi:hypothetical protein ACWGJ9_11625 [Curtobacterium citreum]